MMNYLGSKEKPRQLLGCHLNAWFPMNIAGDVFLLVKYFYMLLCCRCFSIPFKIEAMSNKFPLTCVVYRVMVSFTQNPFREIIPS